MGNKLKILVIGVMIAAIILGGVYSLFHPEYVVSDPSIEYTVLVAENLSGMKSVEVNGTVCNDGDKEIKNVSINVIFTDTAHNEVVRQTVMERVDLLPNGVKYFTAEYSREPTLPKTEVDVEVQVDWEGKINSS